MVDRKEVNEQLKYLTQFGLDISKRLEICLLLEIKEELQKLNRNYYCKRIVTKSKNGNKNTKN